LQEAIGVFQTIRPIWIIGFLLVLFFNSSVSAFKWWVLLRADGIAIPFLSLLSSYLVGSFFNMFLPSNIGGDAYRIYDVARYSKRPMHAFASVFADRVSGYLALTLLAIAVGCYGIGLLPHALILVLPVMAFVALGGLIYFAYNPRLPLYLLGHVARFYDFRPSIQKVHESFVKYQGSPLVISQIMIISFVFQAMVPVSIYCLARGLVIPVSFAVFLIIVPYISMIEAIPITVFGLGLRDMSYAYFLLHLGVSEEAALMIPLAYVVLTLVYVSIGGVIFLVRPRMGKSLQNQEQRHDASL
jgi:uncharacterized protein (TIRG00374 family)